MTSDISRLVNLTSLSLMHNTGVTCLPESISCLQKLERLEVDSCPLIHLPESVSCLQALEVLEVDCCPLSQLPAGLGMLGNLSTLSICNTLPGMRFPLDVQVTLAPHASVTQNGSARGSQHVAPGMFCSCLRDQRWCFSGKNMCYKV